MKRTLAQLGVILAAGSMATAAFATPAFAARAQAPTQAPTQAPAHRPKLTADEIVGKAITDLKSATSVRVYTRLSLDGTTIAERETYAEQGCLTNVSIANRATSISESVLVIGTSEWVQFGNEFWRILGYTGAQLTSLEGKWVTLPAFEQLLGIKNLPELAVTCSIHSASTGLSKSGWTLGRSKQINGRWAWRVIEDSVDGLKVSVCVKPHTKCTPLTISAYVSDTGKPEFVSLNVVFATEHFYAYNQAVTLTAPPAADVLTSIPKPPHGGLLAVHERQEVAALADAVH
jgi:hypothetical protein